MTDCPAIAQDATPTTAFSPCSSLSLWPTVRNHNTHTVTLTLFLSHIDDFVFTFFPLFFVPIHSLRKASLSLLLLGKLSLSLSLPPPFLGRFASARAATRDLPHQHQHQHQAPPRFRFYNWTKQTFCRLRRQHSWNLRSVTQVASSKILYTALDVDGIYERCGAI